MFPVRIIVGLTSRNDPRLTTSLRFDAEWQPGKSGCFADFAGGLARDVLICGLGAPAIAYRITVWNATVPDCESQPRALIVDSDRNWRRIADAADSAVRMLSNWRAASQVGNEMPTRPDDFDTHLDTIWANYELSRQGLARVLDEAVADAMGGA